MKILKKKNNNNNGKNDNEYPLIPLREMVIFPESQAIFYVGRKESVDAINLSISFYDKMVFLSTQKNPKIEKPKKENLYSVGTLGTIIDVNPGPDKNVIRVMIKGLERAKILEINEDNEIKKVVIEKIKPQILNNSLKSETLLTFIIKEFKKFIELAKLSQDIIKNITEAENEDILVNLIISQLVISLEKKYELLEEIDITKRLNLLANLITSNIEVLLLEKKINHEVRKKMDKAQKEFYLNEKIREIQKELGNPSDEDGISIEDFEKKLNDLGMPEIVKTKVLKEYKKLIKIPSLSPEAGVIRNYIDSLLELPWSKKSEDSNNINNSKKILDEDHYSLKNVKNRILEFLAVRQLNKNIKGPILCFVGSPGTGKTSLGKSVARAIGREFVRISLGGVRDEAEIRGHRRTYLSALPGKIIQSMKKAKTKNPVFLLDEIDKMSSDFRGDPASALLEVLDPEQNNQFVDHYLEIPYDLSEVMFITTANSKQGIPYPLLDRMEIIYIPSYTEIEKVNIAKKFLLPKEKKENGIDNIDLKINNSVILEIIRSYTMEAGVRSLQRQIASICRKIAKRIVADNDNNEIKSVIISKKNLTKFLGKKKYIEASIDKVLDIGVSHGLGWSEVGGTILPIEVVLYPGNGKITLTGKLGEVMKESAQTAFSYIRANAHLFNIKITDFYKDYDVHIHFPEGAIPKDGPSAGIAITCGILSCLTRIPIRSKFAMTGEITLTGKILPIGGLKEKTLAALRHNKEKIIIPFENEKDIEDLPKSIREKLEFIKIKRANEVFELVFESSIFLNNINNNQTNDSSNNIINDKKYDNIIPQ